MRDPKSVRLLASLEEDMQVENTKNAEKDEHMMDQGDFVTFGSTVVLQHLASGKLLSSTSHCFQGDRSSKALLIQLVNSDEETSTCHIKLGCGYRA